MRPSKILSKKTTYKAKYFHVDQVVLERNGKQFTKDIIEKNSFVLIIALTDKNEIVLERQYRDALQKETLEIVAGTMEEGETDTLAAAKRELREETGYTAKYWQQIGMMEVSANQKNTVYVFVATGLTAGETALDDDEEIEVIKIPINQVMEKVTSGEIFIATNVAALLKFNEMWKNGMIEN